MNIKTDYRLDVSN